MEGYICRYADKCPLFDYTSKTCLKLLSKNGDRSYCGQWKDFEKLGIVEEAMHTRVREFEHDFSNYIAILSTKITK